jgi:hypothetical protein
MQSTTSLVTGRCSIILFSLMLPHIVGQARAQDSDPSKRAFQEAAIREAVIRYQMAAWVRQGDKNEKEGKNERDRALAKQLNFRVFFVSIGGKDPSEEFLKRFQDIPRVVKKKSRAQTNSLSMEWVTDKDTHQPGIIFQADEVHWTKENEVEVAGGYHCGGLCAAGEVFTVRLENAKWNVLQSRMTWIS